MTVYQPNTPRRLTALLLTALLLCACVASEPAQEPTAPPPSSAAPTAPGQCPTERPQLCIELYKPVCATRDTGVRCVTTPCPSTETATYANSCKACSDKRVLSYQPGACAS